LNLSFPAPRRREKKKKGSKKRKKRRAVSLSSISAFTYGRKKNEGEKGRKPRWP